MTHKSGNGMRTPPQPIGTSAPVNKVDTLTGFLLAVVALSSLMQGAWLPCLAMWTIDT